MLAEGMFVADRYEILGKIGAGGMSDVYKAKDHVLGRYVAIKVLKQEFSEDVNFVTKFRTEAQSAGGLEHPNIVNIYDVGSEDGMHFIVMEYVEGITLKTYIEKKGQLSFKEAVSIAIQVGRGIEAAHHKHIVHRDIKPQNIIISTEGKVKVTDFGIARAATSNTINSDVMGSVHYASPEQARNGFVDGKSDIYSLGIVMYEMVTGRVPFDGDTTVAVAIQHLQEEMVSPSAYAKDLPISLEKIILKSTQKNPDRRYQNMEELLLDLKKSLISPNEDFVMMIPLGNQDKTRVIGADELAQINKGSNKSARDDMDLEEDNEDEDENESDEEEGILNPKMEKAVTIMGIVAAIIIIGIIVFIVGNALGIFKFGGSKKSGSTEAVTQTEQMSEKGSQADTEMVQMIDVTNMTLDEAKTALDKIGLKVAQDGTTSSDDIEEGKIVSQSVDKGKKVASNTTIKVVVSSGAGAISIPDVSKLSSAEASKKLTDMGFVVATNYDYSDSIEQDHVISTNPAANSSGKKGDTVTIVLSRGIETVQVPDVQNKPQADAQTELQNAGLTVNVASSEYNDTVPDGCVISQSIVGGKYVDKGTSISLVISQGKKTVYYTYKETINVPKSDDGKTYTKLNLVLKDADGNTLDTQEKAVDNNSGAFEYTSPDIANSATGTLTKKWTYTDESGKSQTEENSSAVKFTQK